MHRRTWTQTITSQIILAGQHKQTHVSPFLQTQQSILHLQLHNMQIKKIEKSCHTKLLRVIIRNLHPTTALELIKEELEIRLFEVRHITDVLNIN